MPAEIYEEKALRNRCGVFEDRTEAGQRLADMLQREYKGAEETVALAIPSGGVPVGLEVARKLACPLDLVIVRKIPIPGNPEAGYGAVALEGGVFLNEVLVKRLNLDSTQIDQHISQVMEELQARNREFRGNRPFPQLTGKVAILVDDGLASGYTMMASVHQVRDKGAKRIIVAVPTAPRKTVEKIAPAVDACYCPNIRHGAFFAVADAYKNWYDLDRKEVLDLLRETGFHGGNPP